MTLVYIFAFALIAAVIIYYMFFTKSNNDKEEFTRDRSTTQEKHDRNFTIENIGPGGKFSVSNFGENNDFLNITITDKVLHEEGDNFWYELEGETSHGDPFWLQIESIDPYDLNGGKDELDFNELGLSTADLESLLVGKESFELDNEKFYLDYAGEARAYTEEDDEYDSDENFRWYRYWEFINKGSDVYIAIQQFENSTPEVTISYPITQHQLKIFELGEDVE